MQRLKEYGVGATKVKFACPQVDACKLFIHFEPSAFRLSLLVTVSDCHLMLTWFI